jgi:hypothetical protein
VHHAAIGISIFDVMVVENMTTAMEREFGRFPNLPSPMPDAGNRMCQRVPFTVNPVANINVVAVLLDKVVATQPVEDVPTMRLKLHFRFPFHPLAAICGTAAVPIDTGRNDIADRPRVNAVDPFDIPVFVSPLETRTHGQTLFFGEFVCLHTAAVSLCIDAEWLLNKDVLPLLDGVQIMDGMETGGRSDQHQVGEFCHHFIVIEPTEKTVGR